MLKPPPVIRGTKSDSSDEAGKSKPKTREEAFEHGHSVLHALIDHHLDKDDPESELFKKVSSVYGEKNAHKLVNGAARAANVRPGSYGIPETHGEDNLRRPAQASDKTGFFNTKAKSRVSGTELPPPPPLKPRK